MEVGLVHKVDIDAEMQQAYLDYAMSVIVSRALPDARDGLKPVHRRILYAMHDMGMRFDAPYKKSARIVGEVLGKYHPHGDAAVYEAMARMAQSFSLRYLLIDGQGNFGSVDGDPPAAMRYTEARLAPTAAYMLADISHNTVDFTPNFDGALVEPSVLPAALPNLLVNGATGIAVGMATSIPPHNLTEISAAMQFLLQNWDNLDDIGVEDLLRFVEGPDFPTGGMIVLDPENDGLIGAYGTGRGQVTIQARAHLEEMERGRSRIIVTELPYMTNKSTLIERIADYAREERIEGIADLRDESDRQGMRIVIELSKTADPERVLRDLLKHTPMQTTFSVILLALVDGEPRMLSLKTAMRVYLEHRLEIVRRRSVHELERLRARLHILEGLRVALKNLDEVIQIIRKAADADAARERLMKRFKLTEIQTNAILDMPLRRLAALERKKIEEEFRDVTARIKELESLLKSPAKMRKVVGDELHEVQEKFGDRRRTHIVRLKPGQTTASLLTSADTLPDQPAWLCLTRGGLISRSLAPEPPLAIIDEGSSADAPPAGEAAPAWLVRVGSRDTLYLAAENGEAAALPVHAVPETNRPEDGAPYYKVSALTESHRPAVVFAIPPEGRAARAPGSPPQGAPGYILTVTRSGMVKKTALEELPGPSASRFVLVKINPGDRLGWARLTSGSDDLLLAASSGMAIRFSEEDVRPMGLVAAGVSGIKLAAGAQVIGAGVVEPGDQLVLIVSGGRARRTPLDEFPRQGRYGQGVLAWKAAAGERVLAAALVRGDEPMLIHPGEGGLARLSVQDIPRQNRAGRGSAPAALRPLSAGRKSPGAADESELLLTIPWRSPFHAESGPQPDAAASEAAGKRPGKRRAPAGEAGPKRKPPVKAGAGSAKPGPARPAGTKKAAPAPKTGPGGKSASGKPATTARRTSVAEKPASKAEKASEKTAAAGRKSTAAVKAAAGAADSAKKISPAKKTTAAGSKPAAERTVKTAGKPAPAAKKTAATSAARKAGSPAAKTTPVKKSRPSAGGVSDGTKPAGAKPAEAKPPSAAQAPSKARKAQSAPAAKTASVRTGAKKPTAPKTGRGTTRPAGGSPAKKPPVKKKPPAPKPADS